MVVCLQCLDSNGQHDSLTKWEVITLTGSMNTSNLANVIIQNGFAIFSPYNFLTSNTDILIANCDAENVQYNIRIYRKGKSDIIFKLCTL